jgi:hypothetical protein
MATTAPLKPVEIPIQYDMTDNGHVHVSLMAADALISADGIQ